MADDLWTKIERTAEHFADPAQEARSTASSPQADDEAEKAKKKRVRRVVRLLDVLAVLLWSYFVFKLFVVDVDRVALERFAPWSVRLLGLRFFFWVAVLVVLVGIFKRMAWAYLAYVAAFPLIVMFWKVPRLVHRRGSWMLFVGIVNVAANVLHSLTYSFVTKGLAVIAALLALAARNSVVVIASSGYLLGLLVLSFWRTLRAALARSRFLVAQEEGISRLLDSKVVKNWVELGPDFKATNIELYSQEQLATFRTNLSCCVILNRGLFFWAYQLEKYRQTIAGVILGLVSWLFLLVVTIGILTVVNIGIYHVDSKQFSVTSEPSIIRMTLYSFSTLALNAAAGIDASGDWASAVRVLAGVLGVVLLLGVLLNALFSIRRERESSAIEAAVERLKERASALETQLVNEYEVTVAEAAARLDKLGPSLIFLLSYITSSVPPDFIDDDL